MTRYLIATAVALSIGSGIGVQTQAGSAAGRQGEPVRPAPAAPAAGVAAQEVTLIGCVEFEQDYRKRMAAGRGGVLGTGAGANDEFVLTNVRPAKAEQAGRAASTAGAQGRTGATGTSGVGSGGGVYTLTGDQETNLKRDVGRQIEVVGKIENAGERSTGADITDISDLPRIAITTWHPVGDFCPAK
jgi:hypothetical protein